MPDSGATLATMPSTSIAEQATPLLVRVVRDGVVESVHTGTVVVCDAGGSVLGSLGDPDLATYVRSAAKPFQALATLELLAEAGVALDEVGLAIATASHDGSDDHQIEAARLLAEAGLDESALRCPPAWAADLAVMRSQPHPQRLAHNCSGKHASFLLAHTATGGDPATYLDTGTRLQQRIRSAVERVCGATPRGPGVDGCGAPAWLLPLRALATGFARLAAGVDEDLAAVRAAMAARPDLIGGSGAFDTELMLADGSVVAKRGAEAVIAAATTRRGEAVGVAVKVADGGKRADGPVVAAVLESLGCAVPPGLRRPVVLGGGQPHGALEVDAAVSSILRR